MKHQNGSGGTVLWRRGYDYQAWNNQLLSTSIAGDDPDDPSTYGHTYSYNARGAMLEVSPEGLIVSENGVSLTPLLTISEGGAILAEGGVPVVRTAGAIPQGFASAAEFEAFGQVLKEGLDAAGLQGTKALFQGSSVTGAQYVPPFARFDLGRLSDFDIALGGSDAFAAAKSNAVPLRAAGTRTAPLTGANLRDLGLYRLSQKLSTMAGREVNFMIFEDPATAAARSPSIVVP